MTDQSPDNPPDDQPAFSNTPPPSTPTVGADLGIRFVARLLDGILLGIVNWIVFLVIVRGILSLDTGFGSSYVTAFGAGAFISALITTGITIGYFTFMESSRGQTVGKMLLGLRTVAPGGGNPTTEEAFKRNLFYALAIIPIIGGLAELAAVIYIAITINSSSTHQGWHDDFAGGTKVVKV